MSESILPVTANNNSGNSLPRGLVSKSGLPFNPNQRLPSLRSSLSKPSLLFQSSASFNQIVNLNSSSSSSSTTTSTTTTKSPVSKRNYESSNGSGDSVVTTRRGGGGEGKGFTNGAKGKNSLDSRKGSSSSSTSSGRGRRQNVKKSKKFIQLESTVFTGASRKELGKDSPNGKKSRSKKATISSPPIQELSEDSIEPAFIEGKLYQDDFINRSGDEGDNSEHLPQGWESLSLPNFNLDPVTPNSDHWLTPDPLRDKLILFQLPKMLENSANMKLGKLKIYESGKVELVNSFSDFTFEVAKAGKSEKINKSSTLSSSSLSTTATTTSPSTSSGNDLVNGQLDIKSETSKPDYVEPRLNREVVIYSGRNLISIGKLESDAAIVIPKLFPDS